MIWRSSVKLNSSLRTVVLLAACGQQQDLPPPSSSDRNVILFVGDGFGATQTALGLQFARMVQDRELHIETLMRDGNTGYALPWPFENTVTDSAGAASQFATGRAARVETLGLSAEGYPVETILEWAHGRGLGTGLVTNMRVTHATPAAFAAHQGSRYAAEPELMDDMLREGDVDVLLGGGARALVPAGTRVSDAFPNVPAELDGTSNRNDETKGVEQAEAQGYVVVSDSASLDEAATHARKLLGLFSASHLPYVVDRRRMNLSSVPTVAEMTSAALEVLARSDAGFFLLAWIPIGPVALTAFDQ